MNQNKSDAGNIAGFNLENELTMENHTPKQNQFQFNCIGIYTRIDIAIDEASKRKRRELFEKFAGGER